MSASLDFISFLVLVITTILMVGFFLKIGANFADYLWGKYK